jgi:hypothetical protein
MIVLVVVVLVVGAEFIHLLSWSVADSHICVGVRLQQYLLPCQYVVCACNADHGWGPSA